MGKLGSLIHSYYFDDTEGTFVLFQEKDADQISIAGVEIDSATVKYKGLSFDYSGQFDIDPDLVLNNFPIQFNDEWESVSQFSIGVDSVEGESSMSLTAEVQDSIYNYVDGWGTLILPNSSYECLRVKSLVTLNEKLFLNGQQIRSKMTRTINYYWITKDLGVLAKITSHSNEPDEQFQLAKKVSRIHKFNPKIEFSVNDTAGVSGDILNVPIFISEITDLQITKISMCISCDTSMVLLLQIVKTNTLTDEWHDPSMEINQNSFQIELRGNFPLNGEGVLCYLQFKLLPINSPGTTELCLTEIKVDEPGPICVSRRGEITINFPVKVMNDSKSQNVSCGFDLKPNFPNPFNSSTSIQYQLESPSDVLLEIYNSTGRTVSTLIDQHQGDGLYTFSWNCVNKKNEPFPSGIYFYRLRCKNEQESYYSYDKVRKMIKLR